MDNLGLPNRLSQVDDNFLASSRKMLLRENHRSQSEFKELSKRSFSIKKDLLLFSGSLFGSSIALSSGKDVNLVFLVGEFLVFLSILLSLVLIKSDLKAEEWSWAFFTKNSYENFLQSSKKKISEFELKIKLMIRSSHFKIYCKTINLEYFLHYSNFFLMNIFCIFMTFFSLLVFLGY